VVLSAPTLVVSAPGLGTPAVQINESEAADSASIRGQVRDDLALAKHVPPRNVEFLLATLAMSRCADAMIGDLNERFARECESFGRDRAVRLFWARTLRSVPPLVRQAASGKEQSTRSFPLAAIVPISPGEL